MLRTLTVPFGEWRPDSAELNTGFMSIAKNVRATATGYKRMGNFSSSGGSLPTKSRGAAFGSNFTTILFTFAGTATKLYRAATFGGVLTDVSRLAGGNYAATNADRWYFAQSGTAMVAVNPNDTPQVYADVGAAGNFAALGGSPPNATGVSQVGDFMFLWGLASNKRKLQWSAINSITGWTVGTSLSDEQTFPDLGNITGVYGDQSGYVLQQHGVRSFQFLPGDTTTIFQFSKIPGAMGCVSPYGWTAAPDGNIYYFSNYGFHVIGPGGFRNIGQSRVNEWFDTESTAGFAFRPKVECVAFADKPIVVWVFNSTATADADYDRTIFYDYSLDRFVHGDHEMESVVKYAYGTGAGENLDAMMFSATGHAFGNMVGSQSVATTLTFAEAELFPGKLALVSAVRPTVQMIELDNMEVSDANRNTLEASPTTLTTSTADADGKFGIGVGGRAARYHRFTISATQTSGDATDRFQGIEVLADEAGAA